MKCQPIRIKKPKAPARRHINDTTYHHAHKDVIQNCRRCGTPNDDKFLKKRIKKG
jgi:hypothetical protein